MSYSNVTSPRIYTSLSNYLMASGIPAVRYASGAYGGYDELYGTHPGGVNFTYAVQLLGMSPSDTKPMSGGTDGYGGGGHVREHRLECLTNFKARYSWDINYVAILNHATQHGGFQPMYFMAGDESWDYLDTYEIVNWSGTGADLNGFSIIGIENNTNYYEAFKFTTPMGDTGYPFATPLIQFGAFLFGSFYDLPVSPELSIITSREYDGIDITETKGGALLHSKKYSRPTTWGYGRRKAWQLWGDEDYAPSWGYHTSYFSGQFVSSGRRAWELEFNNIEAIDLEPFSYYGIGVSETAGDPDDQEAPNYTTAKKNWFRDVLHYTKGGQLPFVFCPDSDVVYNANEYTVPEFALCKFDMKSFEREQVAYNVYNMKIKIVEVW